MQSSRTQNRPVLLAANSSWNLINFRAPVIAGLRDAGYAVHAAVPDDKSAAALAALGVELHSVPVDAKGLSPVRDGVLLLSYRRLLRRLRPAAMLPFTAKPNIYGSIAARFERIPVINTITGLGTGFLSGAMLQRLMSGLYRVALGRSHRVFFHNEEDRDLFVSRKFVRRAQAAVVAGSGVDLDRFSPQLGTTGERPLTFLFIGRLLKDKGAMEFIEAAETVHNADEARFRMLGSFDAHPKAVPAEALTRARELGVVELLGSADDVRPFIADADCVVLPSYREGLPRVVLEASAMGKPVIVSDVPGCRQAVDDGVSGILCEARSARSLADAMIAMMKLSPEERSLMGRRGREKAEREFSQERVASAYLEALREAGV